MAPCFGLLPWAPFLLSILGRAAVFFACAGWLEAQLVGIVPRTLQLLSYYGAFGYILVYVGHLITGSCKPTPDLAIHTDVGVVRKDKGSVPWCACSMRGWRPHMEDAHVCQMLDAFAFPDTALFAVMDGHGGSDVSKVVSGLLPEEMSDCGRRHMKAGAKCSLKEVFLEALPRIDEKLGVGPLGLGRLLPPVMHPFLLMGSTSVAVGVDFARREVVAANIGDSRAMLIRNGEPVKLTEDHKPENPLERSRITSAGGRVMKMGPCYRIDGSLNLSRAFGDFALKAHKGLPPDKQRVIAFPDVMQMPFQDGDILLVGCDGLFERCSWQDVADLVWSRLEKGQAMEQVAQELLHACCAKHWGEEGTDNETVILVRLPPSKAPISV